MVYVHAWRSVLWGRLSLTTCIVRVYTPRAESVSVERKDGRDISSKPEICIRMSYAMIPVLHVLQWPYLIWRDLDGWSADDEHGPFLHDDVEIGDVNRAL